MDNSANKARNIITRILHKDMKVKLRKIETFDRVRERRKKVSA